MKKIILNIIKKIEELDEDLVVWAYKTSNEDKSNVWWEVSVSDYKFYHKNEKFKKLRRIWYKMAEQKGVKLLFVCGWIPKAEDVYELSKKTSVVMNV